MMYYKYLTLKKNVNANDKKPLLVHYFSSFCGERIHFFSLKEWWKRQPSKVKVTYMNNYVDVCCTDHREERDGDSRDLKVRQERSAAY